MRCVTSCVFPILLSIVLVTGDWLYAEEARIPTVVAERERELAGVAEQFKRAVLAGDVLAILRYVSKRYGMTCVDKVIPFQQILRDITTRDSYLHVYLFEPSRYRSEYGKDDKVRPLAVKEIFKRSRHLRARITFTESEKQNYSWATIHYESELTEFGVSLHLGYRRGPGEGWTIDSGLYDCGGGL